MTAPSVREALQICRDFIRGEMIEAAVVDVGTMQSLGEMIDAALNATPPAPTPSAAAPDLRRLVLDLLNDVAPAVENLACHQEQCDQDGVMVKVSRQALEEVLSAVNEVAIQAATALLPDAAAISKGDKS